MSKFKIVINWKKILLFFIVVRVLYLITTNLNHPDDYLISDFPLIQQPDSISCGPTSCAMILSFYKKDIKVEECKILTKTTWFRYQGKEIGMTTPEYIRECLNSNKLNYSLAIGSISGIKARVSKNKPVIVLLRSGEYTWHYVVVIGYDKNNLILADPGYGKKEIISNENFIRCWSFKGDMSGKDFSNDSNLLSFLLKLAEVNPYTMVY